MSLKVVFRVGSFPLLDTINEHLTEAEKKKHLDSITSSLENPANQNIAFIRTEFQFLQEVESGILATEEEPGMLAVKYVESVMALLYATEKLEDSNHKKVLYEELLQSCKSFINSRMKDNAIIVACYKNDNFPEVISDLCDLLIRNFNDLMSTMSDIDILTQYPKYFIKLVDDVTVLSEKKFHEKMSSVCKKDTEAKGLDLSDALINASVSTSDQIKLLILDACLSSLLPFRVSPECPRYQALLVDMKKANEPDRLATLREHAFDVDQCARKRLGHLAFILEIGLIFDEIKLNANDRFKILQKILDQAFTSTCSYYQIASIEAVFQTAKNLQKDQQLALHKQVADQKDTLAKSLRENIALIGLGFIPA